jgi:hypothetical protein
MARIKKILKARRAALPASIGEGGPAAIKEQKGGTDLRAIMDYSKPLRIFYSGVENELYFNSVFAAGARNFLMSYHYLSQKGAGMDARFAGEGVKLIIDSGAFTFMGEGIGQRTAGEWEAYIESYLAWAEKNRGYIFAIVNCDFEHVAGAAQTERWNREYFEPFMLRTGIPVCFVWHEGSTMPFEDYCARYPFVGFSSVSGDNFDDGMGFHREKLRIAEKHGTLVHGFGMTRMGMLSELPYYSVDSTTWNVGLKYGELNYFDRDSGKLRRLKKEAWKGDMLNFFANSYGGDRKKLLAEDAGELIKMCVRSFVEAENYVRQKLKAMMYWMRPKIQKNDAGNLPIDFFPVPSWFTEGDREGAGEYARKMNLNPEADLLSTIRHATAFMNWDSPAYALIVAEYMNDQGAIIQLHKDLVNKVTPDVETMVAELRDFFEGCIRGDNTKLLYRGTAFDRAVRERDEYVEQDETEEAELSPDEVRLRLLRILPKSEDGQNALMPEVDALDKEIFESAGIAPVYDRQGKFVAGRARMLARKAVYPKGKYPKYACDTCRTGSKCPEYRPGYVCAFQKTFEQFDTRKVTDIISAMQTMAEYNVGRMQKAMIEEVLLGETANPAVSLLINQNMALLSSLNKLYSASSREVLRQTRVIHPDGSVLERNELVNPQAGGIIAKLFSGNASGGAGAEAGAEPCAEMDEPAESAPRSEKTAGAAYQGGGDALGDSF